MKCNFVVGQKVVCIVDYSVADTEEWAVLFGIEFPLFGVVYTVREITIRPFGEHDEVVGILLSEILNLPNPCHRNVIGGEQPSDECFDAEIAWHQDDFRPLVSASTDISLFQEMLTPAGRIPVDA